VTEGSQPDFSSYHTSHLRSEKDSFEFQRTDTMTATAPEAPKSPQATHPPLVLLLDYRATIESVDLDAANQDAWREALDAFGYQNLDDATFLQQLALSTSSEVMMALCPYTTKDEWGPALNKRDVKLAAAVENMCYANAVPVPGIAELISTAARLRRTTVVMLSPFREDVTRALLQTCGLGNIIDAVVCYTSLDVAVLEALAALHCTPPSVPPRFADAMPHAFADPDPEYEGADIVAFVSTSTAAKKMRGYGVSLVGVLHNSVDQEEDGANNDDESDPEVLPGRDDATALRAAGCELAVIDFTHITPGHLSLLRSQKQVA
jgi:phosphoglycolate phosphatase-like HAD superfamily hydrolase